MKLEQGAELPDRPDRILHLPPPVVPLVLRDGFPGGVAARGTWGFVVVERGQGVRDCHRLKGGAGFRFAHTGAVTSKIECPGFAELPQLNGRRTIWSYRTASIRPC